MMIFRMHGEYFSLKQPNIGQRLFSDLQEYTLMNFTASEATDLSRENYLIEIMFPESLPLETIKSLFILDDPDEKLPNWTYQTMYLVFDEEIGRASCRERV